MGVENADNLSDFHGRMMIHCGQWTVDSGSRTVDSGQWTVEVCGQEHKGCGNVGLYLILNF